MYGHPWPFGPGGGGCVVAQPPQHQQIHLNPNLFPYLNLSLLQQNPNFLPHFNPFLQNPNSSPQNQQQFINRNFPIQLNSSNNDVQTPQPDCNNNSKFPVQHAKVQREMVDKLDKAVIRARTELLESNQNVSSWQVSQVALLMVKAESWESLGLKMQQVPSLNHLLLIEAKINAFIHCFVAVKRITSLYDLEVAICESEGIERFEELGLGPLLQHPLAVHYFSVTSDVTEVHIISNEVIIFYLCEFIDTHKKNETEVDAFLDFICEKQSVSGREKLCVRVQNLGVYLNHIKKARQSEDRVLEKCYEKMRTKSVERSGKHPLFSSHKKEMDDQFTAISQRMKSFSSSNTLFCGKHIRFTSSSSDDDSDANEYDENQDEKKTDSSLSLPRVSRCPYPSATEEMTRLRFKSKAESGSCTDGGGVRCNADNELSKRKRKYENMSCRTSLPRNRNKRIKATLLENCLSTKVEEESSSVRKKRTAVISNWPPVDWKTAPGFNSISTFGLKKPLEGMFAEKSIVEQSDISIAGISSEFNIEVGPTAIAQDSVLLEAEISETRLNNSSNLVGSSMNTLHDSVDLSASDSKNFLTTNCTERDQVSTQQAQLTGRLGELVASKYFVGKFGEAFVNWVNEITKLDYLTILCWEMMKTRGNILKLKRPNL